MSADADLPPVGVRTLVSEPVPQNLDGGRQTAETRDGATTPGKVGLGDSVAGNARPSRGLPFDSLHVSPAPAAQPSDD